MALIINFFRPRDDAEGPTIGPFPWVQVTHTRLRAGPDGDTIAVLGDGGYDWYLHAAEDEPWSDFTISSFERQGDTAHG